MKWIIRISFLLLILTPLFFISSAYAWRYKFKIEDNGSRKEIGLNGIGIIDSLSSDSIVIDDSSFSVPRESLIKQIETGQSYPFSLKEGMYVGYELDSKHEISVLYVFTNEENYRKLKSSSD